MTKFQFKVFSDVIICSYKSIFKVSNRNMVLFFISPYSLFERSKDVKLNFISIFSFSMIYAESTLARFGLKKII